MMFKYSIGEVPKPISQLFRTNNEYHQYNTRNGSCLHAPIGKSEAIYHTFKYRGIHIWNHISNKVSTDVSYACFKHLVKHYIQTNMLFLLRLNVWQMYAYNKIWWNILALFSNIIYSYYYLLFIYYLSYVLCYYLYCHIMFYIYCLQLSIEIIKTSTESYASVLYILFSPNI